MSVAKIVFRNYRTRTRTENVHIAVSLKKSHKRKLGVSECVRIRNAPLWLPPMDQLGDVRGGDETSYKGPSCVSAFTVSGGWTLAS